MVKRKKAGAKKYQKPQDKKVKFNPKIKKCKKLNTVICSCSVVYGACSGGGNV